jgi:hypothetical protein
MACLLKYYQVHPAGTIWCIAFDTFSNASMPLGIGFLKENLQACFF